MVPSCDVRAHWRTHFASATFSSSHYCDDFFASVSRHSRMTTARAGSTLHSLTTNWSQRLPGFTNLRQVLLGWPVLFSRCTFRGGDIHFSLLFQQSSPMGRLSVHLEIKCCGPSLPNEMVTPSRDSYRPISLVSCASKIFEHMIHSRIAPNIFPQLDWCHDVMACSPCDSASSPLPHSHSRRIHRHQESLRFVLGGGHFIAFARCWCVWAHVAQESQFLQRHTLHILGYSSS